MKNGPNHLPNMQCVIWRMKMVQSKENVKKKNMEYVYASRSNIVWVGMQYPS